MQRLSSSFSSRFLLMAFLLVSFSAAIAQDGGMSRGGFGSLPPNGLRKSAFSPETDPLAISAAQAKEILKACERSRMEYLEFIDFQTREREEELKASKTRASRKKQLKKEIVEHQKWRSEVESQKQVIPFYAGDSAGDKLYRALVDAEQFNSLEEASDWKRELKFAGQGGAGDLDELSMGDFGQIGYELKPWKVIQVIGTQSMLVSYDGTMFWIEGVSTAGLVDDQIAELSRVYYVKGTKTYRTAFASRTVLMLIPVDLEKIKALATDQPMAPQ